MDNAQRLKILTGLGKTVFSLTNFQNLWGGNIYTTKVIAKRMVDKKLITRIARGYYALSEEFNIYELANLIISPSYVSLNSSLFYYGISFQVSNIITSVSTLSYKRKIGKMTFKYYFMKDSLFFNIEGINYKNNLAIARPERAILDCFYFNTLPNIDNIDKLNIGYLKKISLFYPNTVQIKLKKFLGKL